jgi:type II secretory pathway pseudopilin PulG
MTYVRRMLRARPAFTLVELMVSMLLIDVALLALVASGALVIRQASDGHVHSSAVRAAVNRLESLSARFPCVASTGYVVGPHGLREDWSVRPVAAGEREIVDSVRYPQSSGTRAVVLRARTPC